ncbi:hypothetical protein A8C32_18205 [Flavivirga aquatica]|uniref:Uncharacterized protein n=1 Tax=Flavivirga aquatica TaxID=1849968 RepID=A0A1E5T7N6_9FLAO|nr:hypothetical protein [Flavivirga aquatica]OEK07370.1 hypothetical protein A8C32_18205 [Flavivirga aquatica]
MVKQNTKDVQDDLLQTLAEGYHETFNQLIDQLKDQLADKLINKIQDIQKDTKKLIKNHPLKPISKQVELLMDKHLGHNIEINLNTFIKEVIVNTLTAEKMPNKLEQMYKNAKGFIEQHYTTYSKDDIRKLLQHEYLTEDLSKQVSLLISRNLENTIDNYYNSVVKENTHNITNIRQNTLAKNNDLSKLKQVPKKAINSSKKVNTQFTNKHKRKKKSH